jgi:hypothetical protein
VIFGVDLGVRSFAIVGLYEEDEVGEHPHIAKFFEMVRGRTRYHELRAITQEIQELVLEDDILFVEEPPLAGVRNIRTFAALNQTAAVILSATAAQGYLVPVDSWKKATLGTGGTGKPVVAEWLSLQHPDLHKFCGGNQNLVDAACIALYGQQLVRSAGGADITGSRNLDISV